MKQLKLWIAAAALLSAQTSFAYEFTAESMDSWSGCDADCKNQNKLNYTDDQIRMFSDAMYDAGWARSAWYRNQDVWGTDLRDDALSGGQDHLYVDSHTMYIYSGHGKTEQVSNKQRFYAPMCHASYAAQNSCYARSQNIHLGERVGEFAASPGNIRYLILATCYSVHTKANEQWGDYFRYGGDVIFGYRNTSADSEYTDEVPADFAWAAFDDDDRFKGAWFWAIEDWWVNDTGALITAGINSTQAHNRRDQMTRHWARRPNAELHTYRTWTWHEG